jgi:hypothetical protein
MKWLVIVLGVILGIRMLAEGMATVKAQRQEPEFLTPPGVEAPRQTPPAPRRDVPRLPVLPPRFISPRDR